MAPIDLLFLFLVVCCHLFNEETDARRATAENDDCNNPKSAKLSRNFFLQYVSNVSKSFIGKSIPMESTSMSRFRFRDHQEMGESSESDTDSDISSVSSDTDGEAEPQSMTGKGIKRLCSELLELKRASDEDFHRNIFSNYSAFVRIFKEVKGIENELVQLRNYVSTQKMFVKDLTDGIYLEALSEKTMDAIIGESDSAEPSSLSNLKLRSNDVLETIDTFLSEQRLDEALDMLELEAVTFERIQLKETLPQVFLTSYNTEMSERKTLLEIQLMLVAENPRVPAPELQKALVGLCRLGESHLATKLLLKYYHSRIDTRVQNLQSSKSLLRGVYIRDLSKFVFSMISQAARSFVMLHGESSSYASELILWACEETETFAACLKKFIKSISEVSGGLSTAVEAVQDSMSFCSLLEAQRIGLRPCLIKHIRPCMEDVLHIHLNHFKKVICIFTAIDSWVLGRYLVSGILLEECSMIVGHQPDYCLLTNSGRKFVTLLQAITEDISPLLAIQMEGSFLKGLKDLFTEYIIILEKAITCGENVIQKGGSRINMAETLPQQVAILVNTSTLVHFYSSVISSIFNTTSDFNYELKEDQSIGVQQKELDNFMLHIQKTFSQLRARFCHHMIHKMMSVQDAWRDALESYAGGENDSKTLDDKMPSIVFQVLFSELRKLVEFAEENNVEADWLVDLLRELMEAIFVWISNEREFWTTIEEDLSVQHCGDFNQFVLDMQFLVEVARDGRYLSENITTSSLDLVSRMESVFLSAGLDPIRDDNERAINAASAAIKKLLEVEQTNLFPDEEPNGILEEELYGHQPEYASDSLQDDAKSYSEDATETEDTLAINAAEVANNSDTDILQDEHGSNDGIANSEMKFFEEFEDVGSENAESIETEKLEDIKGEPSEKSSPIEENAGTKHKTSEKVSNEKEDCDAEMQAQGERNSSEMNAFIFMEDCDKINSAVIGASVEPEDCKVIHYTDSRGEIEENKSQMV